MKILIKRSKLKLYAIGIFLILCGLVLIKIKDKLNHRLVTTNDIQILFPENKNKALIMSFDDGNISDTSVVQILNKYGLKGTFFIHINPIKTIYETNDSYSKRRSISKDELKQVYKYHEVGSHGISHNRFDQMKDSLLYLELKESKTYLEQLVNKPVISLSYPYGCYNAKSILYAKQLGYINARTISNTNSFKQPEDLMQWHPTCELINTNKHIADFFEDTTPFVQKWSKIVFHKLGIKYNTSKVMYVWGHATDMENPKVFSWHDFDSLCKKIALHKKEIWTTTAQQLGLYLKTTKNIIKTKYEIHNPEQNQQPIWFRLKNKNYQLNPGETFKINGTNSTI